MKCDTPLRRTLILCDLFNEIFNTGNWGVTLLSIEPISWDLQTFRSGYHRL